MRPAADLVCSLINFAAATVLDLIAVNGPQEMNEAFLAEVAKANKVGTASKEAA